MVQHMVERQPEIELGDPCEQEGRNSLQDGDP